MDFVFPINGYKYQAIYHTEFGYYGLVESPGVAHVVNSDDRLSPAQAVLQSVFHTWPLLVITFVLAYLAGILIWITVS